MSGLRYRLSMRLAHRLGYCKPVVIPPIEPGDLPMSWCYWCGLRGTKLSDLTEHYQPQVLRVDGRPVVERCDAYGGTMTDGRVRTCDKPACHTDSHTFNWIPELPTTLVEHVYEGKGWHR